jgi:hypothetical protein
MGFESAEDSTVKQDGSCAERRCSIEQLVGGWIELRRSLILSPEGEQRAGLNTRRHAGAEHRIQKK